MKFRHRIVFQASALAMMLLLGGMARADVVIGDFEGASFPAAWGNWSTGPGNLGSFPKYSLSTNYATLGGQSLLITNAGYQQNLAFWGGTGTEPGSLADFGANNKILVDVIFPASTESGFAQIFEIAFNSNAPAGFEGRNYTGQGVGWGPGGGGAQTITLEYDYSNHKAAWGGNPTYAQIIFSTNSDPAHGFFHFDNVRLAGAVPEPASLSLVGLGMVAMLLTRRRQV
jgi:hypothetical protein